MKISMSLILTIIAYKSSDVFSLDITCVHPNLSKVLQYVRECINSGLDYWNGLLD